MYIRRYIRLKVIMRFAWKNLLIFTFWSIFVTFSYVYLTKEYDVNIGIPYLPISTIGIAVAFYLGFKNSQSYDRFWEGRKIWGGIVNYCRTWSSSILGYIHSENSGMTENEIHQLKRTFIYRQLAWINSLRIQLRTTTIFDRKNLSFVPNFGLKNDRECKDCIAFFLPPGEYEEIRTKSNAATQLLKIQTKELAEANQKGLFNDFRHMDLMKCIEQFYNFQGMCERIKNTPFPRQYAFFSSVFVWLFILILPFGLVEEFHEMNRDTSVWLNVPFSILISWVFSTMEVVGDNSEDPFENYVNDVPMSAICRTIEIDLMEMLEEKNIPGKVQPINDVLL